MLLRRQLPAGRIDVFSTASPDGDHYALVANAARKVVDAFFIRLFERHTFDSIVFDHINLDGELATAEAHQVSGIF